MTGTLMQYTKMKDIFTGIFFSILIIFVMYIVPVIGLFAWVLLPLPVLFYRLKSGRSPSGIIVAISLAMLISTTGNPIFNALYFGSLLLTGFLLGECIERHLQIEKIILYSCLGVAGLATAVLTAYALTRTTGIEQLISGYMTRYHALSDQLLTESARMYPDVVIDRQLFEQASLWVMKSFPAIIISTYMTAALLNVVLIRRILRNHDIQVKTLENLRCWRAPDKLVIGLIAVSVLILLPVGVLKVVLINCLIIIMTVYFFQGIAVVSFYFQKKRVPFAIKSFFYVLVAIQPLFMLLVIGCGLFDTWMNFRRLDTPMDTIVE